MKRLTKKEIENWPMSKLYSQFHLRNEIFNNLISINGDARIIEIMVKDMELIEKVVKERDGTLWN